MSTDKQKALQRERTKRYRAKSVTCNGVTPSITSKLEDDIALCDSGYNAAVDLGLVDKPANFGEPDCMCKMCIGNRANSKPSILNHGAWKRCENLATNELNRVPLPGDVDYVGVAV